MLNVIKSTLRFLLFARLGQASSISKWFKRVLYPRPKVYAQCKRTAFTHTGVFSSKLRPIYSDCFRGNSALISSIIKANRIHLAAIRNDAKAQNPFVNKRFQFQFSTPQNESSLASDHPEIQPSEPRVRQKTYPENIYYNFTIKTFLVDVSFTKILSW